MPSTLEVDRPRDGVAVVRLNRPKQLNAINETMQIELGQTLADLVVAPTALAQALMEGHPQAYPERLRTAFSADLEFAANIARRLFRGNFLGGAITTRMVQMLNYSPAFREVVRSFSYSTFASARSPRRSRRPA